MSRPRLSALERERLRVGRELRERAARGLVRDTPPELWRGILDDFARLAAEARARGEAEREVMALDMAARVSAAIADELRQES